MSLFGDVGDFLFGESPSYDYSGYNKALELINQQTANVNEYYTKASKSLQEQYGSYYGQEMQDAVNTLAARNIYSSPVSQVSLNRKTKQLADVYANAQSQLEANKVSSLSGIQSQLANYYTSLANTQYQVSMNEYNRNASTAGLLASVGGIAAAFI